MEVYSIHQSFLSAFPQSRKAPISCAMSLCLSACISAAPLGRNSVKFGIGTFYEYL